MRTFGCSLLLAAVACSAMAVEEKICQLATLYGSGRVLQDVRPTPGWKNEIWKDGIANIDEAIVAGKRGNARGCEGPLRATKSPA